MGLRIPVSNLGDHSKITCFILCTDWCPDVLWNIPVLFRVMVSQYLVGTLRPTYDTVPRAICNGKFLK
nr:thioredoxin family protein [Paenibacillus dokdonensis]